MSESEVFSIGSSLFVVRVRYDCQGIFVQGVTKRPGQVIAETDNPRIALTWVQNSPKGLEAICNGKSLDDVALRQICAEEKLGEIKAAKANAEANLALAESKSHAEAVKAEADGIKAAEQLSAEVKPMAALVEEGLKVSAAVAEQVAAEAAKEPQKPEGKLKKAAKAMKAKLHQPL